MYFLANASSVPILKNRLDGRITRSPDYGDQRSTFVARRMAQPLRGFNPDDVTDSRPLIDMIRDDTVLDATNMKIDASIVSRRVRDRKRA
jgi:hypothetical protein